MLTNEIWLPITDYSAYRNISVSTIRRYIKNNQVKYKKEKGKYFIFVGQKNYEQKQLQKTSTVLELNMQVEALRKKIKTLEEENNDLNMLIQVYENRSRTLMEPPELPHC